MKGVGVDANQVVDQLFKIRKLVMVINQLNEQIPEYFQMVLNIWADMTKEDSVIRTLLEKENIYLGHSGIYLKFGENKLYKKEEEQEREVDLREFRPSYQVVIINYFFKTISGLVTELEAKKEEKEEVLNSLKSVIHAYENPVHDRQVRKEDRMNNFVVMTTCSVIKKLKT